MWGKVSRRQFLHLLGNWSIIIRVKFWYQGKQREFAKLLLRQQSLSQYFRYVKLSFVNHLWNFTDSNTSLESLLSSLNPSASSSSFSIRPPSSAKFSPHADSSTSSSIFIASADHSQDVKELEDDFYVSEKDDKVTDSGSKWLHLTNNFFLTTALL